MATLSTRDLIDRGWRDVLAWLPKDIDQLALTSGAVQKRREVRGGAQLLRLAFAYSILDPSLRSTAAWARTQGSRTSPTSPCTSGSRRPCRFSWSCSAGSWALA